MLLLPGVRMRVKNDMNDAAFKPRLVNVVLSKLVDSSNLVDSRFVFFYIHSAFLVINHMSHC